MTFQNQRKKKTASVYTAPGAMAMHLLHVPTEGIINKDLAEDNSPIGADMESSNILPESSYYPTESTATRFRESLSQVPEETRCSRIKTRLREFQERMRGRVKVSNGKEYEVTATDAAAGGSTGEAAAGRNEDEGEDDVFDAREFTHRCESLQRRRRM